jgi:hypothetical protein
MRVLEWIRLPGDLVFAGLGVVPAGIATGLTYWFMKTSRAK